MSRRSLQLGTLALGVLAPGLLHGAPSVKASLGSAFTIVGEQTRLSLVVRSETKPRLLTTHPETPGIAINLVNDAVRRLQSRDKLYAFFFTVRSFIDGAHRLPPLEVSIDGVTLRSEPLDFHVAPVSALRWATREVADRPFDYATALFLPSREPFEGETIPAEVKVYLPAMAPLDKASIAEVEQDGVVAWRFDADPKAKTAVRLRNTDYIGISYLSTLTPIRSGPATIGPGKARLVLNERISRRGQILVQPFPVSLDIPAHSFQVRPLPPDPPEGFEGAVGRFLVAATANTANLEEGDPISIRLTVNGTGNLDTLKAPRLEADPAAWKSYEPNRLRRQGERRDISGTIIFSQIVRPQTPQREVPPFRLVYFDPTRELYEISRSLPIPFTVTSSPGGSTKMRPTLSTPVEEMEGILGLIDPTRGSPRSGGSLVTRYWQWLPALLAALMVTRLVRRRLLPRLQRPPREQEILSALDVVEQSGPGDREFLRAAGHFIERWIPPPHRDEATAGVLSRRDTECFRPGAADTILASSERRDILRALRDSALGTVGVLVASLLIGTTPTVDAAPPPDRPALYEQAAAAWEEGLYRAAIESYRTAYPGEVVPPDVLYNLGNCHHALGEPGLAALYYHRALHADPRHPEARQNLRYLQRTHGSITLIRPDYEEWLARWPRHAYSTLFLAGTWTTALALLALFVSLPAVARFAAMAGLVIGPLLGAAGATAWSLYPGDADFAPPAERGIIVTAKPATARTEAGNVRFVEADTPLPKVIEAPPGSVCRILADRGAWIYVEFGNRTRGWLQSTEVRPVAPATPDHPLLDPPA